MALALCHILPRDQLMRLSVFFLILALLMMIIAFGKHDEPRTLGSYDFDGKRVVELNGDDIYAPGQMVVCPMPKNVVYTKDAKDKCDDYIHYSQAAAYVHIAATSACFIAILIITLAVTPCTQTTARMVLYFWLSVFIPFALSLAGTITFDVGARPAAKDFLEAMGFQGSKLDYRFGFGFNLAIASTTFVITAFLLATVRLIQTGLSRQKDKSSVINKKDIGGLMGLHLVNDDWSRQKKVWASHAKQVECDIVVVSQSENQPDAEGKTSTAEGLETSNKSNASQAGDTKDGDSSDDANEPNSPVYVHQRTNSKAPVDSTESSGPVTTNEPFEAAEGSN